MFLLVESEWHPWVLLVKSQFLVASRIDPPHLQLNPQSPKTLWQNPRLARRPNAKHPLGRGGKGAPPTSSLGIFAGGIAGITKGTYHLFWWDFMEYERDISRYPPAMTGWKFLNNWDLNQEIIYKWVILHCHVWLPEGKLKHKYT